MRLRDGLNTLVLSVDGDMSTRAFSELQGVDRGYYVRQQDIACRKRLAIVNDFMTLLVYIAPRMNQSDISVNLTQFIRELESFLKHCDMYFSRQQCASKRP